MSNQEANSFPQPALCDLDSGTCQVLPLAAPAANPAEAPNQQAVVRYVGDPMCSWCWGSSRAFKALEAHCLANGIGFEVVVGGLRAGGGDAWTDQFRQFLRSEWTRIAEVSGQPFGMQLLDLPQFDYDTEPACRAVVAVKAIAKAKGMPQTTPLAFFSAVQEKFYVHGADPKKVGFYQDICKAFGIDFSVFAESFYSTDTIRRTAQEFVRCRQLGVSSFPSVIVESESGFTTIGRGFVSGEQVINALDALLSTP